jgi:hypothetical protein
LRSADKRACGNSGGGHSAAVVQSRSRTSSRSYRAGGCQTSLGSIMTGSPSPVPRV